MKKIALFILIFLAQSENLICQNSIFAEIFNSVLVIANFMAFVFSCIDAFIFAFMARIVRKREKINGLHTTVFPQHC